VAYFLYKFRKMPNQQITGLCTEFMINKQKQFARNSLDYAAMITA